MCRKSRVILMYPIIKYLTDSDSSGLCFNPILKIIDFYVVTFMTCSFLNYKILRCWVNMWEGAWLKRWFKKLLLFSAFCSFSSTMSAFNFKVNIIFSTYLLFLITLHDVAVANEHVFPTAAEFSKYLYSFIIIYCIVYSSLLILL